MYKSKSYINLLEMHLSHLSMLNCMHACIIYYLHHYICVKNQY